MFTILLFLGLGVSWWFRLLPDIWVYILILPVCLMAFSPSQRKYMFWRAGAKCEANGCDRTWEDGYMLEAHHIKPLHEGGTDNVTNGEMLCVRDHAKAHERLAEKATREGRHNDARSNAYSARQIKKRSIWRR